MITKTKPTILCMFSGGLDSTGAIYKILTDDTYNGHDIHIHSMSLYCVELRVEQEKEAVDNCVEWFKSKFSNRQIKFTRSTHDYMFMGGNLMSDNDLVHFIGGEIALCSGLVPYEYIVIGVTKNDDDRTMSDVNNPTDRHMRARNILSAIFSTSKKEEPVRLYPVRDMNKLEIWEMLPEDLRKMTWSCRRPKNGVPCGRCVPCNELKEIKCSQKM